jgi:hypothetical protein
MKKVVFIHVPKTSGSSLKSFLRQALGDFFIQANSLAQLERQDPLVGRVRDMSDVQAVLAEHAGLALHVDASFDAVRRTTDFRSLACHVFAPESGAYFEQFTVLTMLRQPFRRFLSDYAFVRRMKQADPGFLPDLELGSAEAYFERVHANAMLHFLLERECSRPRRIGREDLERVQERILGCPIHVGIHERYADSIAYFGELLGRRWNEKDVPSHNVGTGAPAYDAKLEAAFRERNALDFELYDFALRLLAQRRQQLHDQAAHGEAFG